MAFTRKKSGNPGSGDLDIIESEGDYALGVIYRMPKGVEQLLNRKEGAPTCYKRDKVQLKCGGQTINAKAYFVVNKYFIEHCNQKFLMNCELLKETGLYHKNSSKPLEQNHDGFLNRIINQMAVHLGNYNKLVECIQPTSEMLRILVKLVDMQSRDVLDYKHNIPRGLANKLAAEFERLTGREMERLPE